MDANRLTREGKTFYKRRNETIERSFADAKKLHSHRYVHMRDLLHAQEQCLFSAACQNMKKMALLSAKEDKKSETGSVWMFLRRVSRLKDAFLPSFPTALFYSLRA